MMIAQYFRKRRSFATGIAVAGASVGQLVWPPFIVFLLKYYHLSGTLLIIAACYFNTALAGNLFRPIETYAIKSEVPKETVSLYCLFSKNTSQLGTCCLLIPIS